MVAEAGAVGRSRAGGTQAGDGNVIAGDDNFLARVTASISAGRRDWASARRTDCMSTFYVASPRHDKIMGLVPHTETSPGRRGPAATH